MTKRAQVWKCDICGNVIEVLHAGAEALVCCGQPMIFMEEHNADKTVEKHVPIIEPAGTGVKVTVGSTLHPMTDEHYVEWIEVINGPYIQRKYLKPGDPPVAEFYVPFSDKLVAREYCNIHGNWTSQN